MSLFKDLFVIDLSTVLAGPSVGTFFAELGAKVIKIEHKRHPDVTRSWKLPSEDSTSAISAYFSSVNYGKEYLSLDLTLGEDYDEFCRLVVKADVMLSNFKKGDDLKLGIEDERLCSLNPQLIHGKVNGFGSESDRVAYDLILQAESGLMSMNGDEDGSPTKMPVAFIDVLAAHQLKEGILLALLERKDTGRGKAISVSLYDAAVCSLMNQASNYLMTGEIPKRMGSCHPNIAPYGELFVTQDQKEITFAIGSDRHFSELCRFLGLAELLKEERFRTNAQRVINRLDLEIKLGEKIQHFTAQTLMDHFILKHVPVGLIRNVGEVFQQPEAQRLIREENLQGITTKRVTSIAWKEK
jgi:crotonobetainyl-CoA:carnitine CoA-transferase CaiB-like acyl-CoA transferase